MEAFTAYLLSAATCSSLQRMPGPLKDVLVKHETRYCLRVAIQKFRLEVCKMKKKSKIPKLCQDIGLDELLLEKIL